MDVFLFPSLFEGLGIAAVEAQCNGLPVLLNETLPEELNVTNLIQRLSINSDIKDWISAIDKINFSRQEREIFQKQVIDAGYDIQANVEYLEKFYLNLLN